MFFSSSKRKIIVNKVTDFLITYLGEDDNELMRKFRTNNSNELHENYDVMLAKLKQWADTSNFSMWDRSVIVGTIECSLRAANKSGCLPKLFVDDYIKKAHYAIHK